MPYNNTPTQNFIAGSGEADIHAAREAGLECEILAQQKFAWFVTYHERNLDGVQKMLSRLLSYQKRADEAHFEWMEAVVATPRAIHYNYRHMYYVHLVKLISSHFETVLVRGYRLTDDGEV